MHRITRRRFAAVLVGMACLPAGARATDADPLLLRAISNHLSYANGFRVKFATGMYRPPSRSSPAGAQRTFAQIVARLRGSEPDDAPLSLSRDRALIHYRTPDRLLHAWLVGPGGVIAQGVSPGPYEGLDFLRAPLRIDARTATRAPVPRGAARTPPPPTVEGGLTAAAALARAAAHLLPGAVGEALAQHRGRLLVLPASDSGSAPYACLPLAGRMLADRWSVVIVPDVHTLADRERSFDFGAIDVRRALVVGDPDLSRDPAWRWTALPAAREEARAFAEAFGLPADRLLTGAAATRERVLAAIDGYDEANVIYIASHAVANSVNPMDGSFVALTGGHLYGRDLRGSRFAAWGAKHPLVILSACQTALGKIFDGGTYGVARGWIAAGAGQVVGSLWNVDDGATQQLMGEFGRNAFQRRLSPEEALRQAQLAARGAFGDDPAAWAGFTVFGAPAAS